MSTKPTTITRRHLAVAAGAAAVGLALPACANGERPSRGPRLSPRPGPSLAVRRASERGSADHGWLDTRHSFSFADYHDPSWMGFGSLRVINEDRVIAGEGFGMHPHRDMEILTYVLSGALSHRDTMGNGGVIVPGDVQHMSAASGVRHSEINPGSRDAVHFLQIWIHPRDVGGAPYYGQRSFSVDERSDRLCLVASPDGASTSLPIRTDARLYASILPRGREVTHRATPGRRTWIQLARGAVRANGVGLAPGDGAYTSEAGSIRIEASEDAELLVFDLG